MGKRIKYASVNLADVAPLYPINRSAMAVSLKGEHYDWRSDTFHSSTPLPWRFPNDGELDNPSFVDLWGEQVGRLTVIGIYSPQEPLPRQR